MTKRSLGDLGGRLFADWSPLRRDPGFRTQWVAQVGSSLGRETARVAIPLQIFLLTDSAAALGLFAAIQLIPTLLFSLGGGAMADAFDRRRLMIVTQAAMAICSVLLTALALVTEVPVALVMALGFLLVALQSIEHPARVAAVPRLVDPSRLTSAIALVSLNHQASGLIGPAISAGLIAIAGMPAAFALQALGYAFATALSHRTPALPPIGEVVRPSLRIIGEGLRYVRDRRIILSAFAVDLNAMIFGLPIALFPVLALEVYGVGPAEVGLLAAARGGGALVAGIFSGWIPRVRRAGRAVLFAVFIFGAASTLIGMVPFSFGLAMMLSAVAGAADLASAVLRNAIVQTATADALRGRVTALHLLAATSGPRVGDVRAAFMAEAWGATAAVVVGGVIAMAGVVGVARIFPELARYRTPTGSAASSGSSRTDDVSPPRLA